MMEMDGRGSTKCRKSRGRDINGILGKFNEENDKIVYSGHLPPSKRRQWLDRKGEGAAGEGF